MEKLDQSTYQGAGNYLPITFIVHSFFLQILDHANTFQLPDAMKVMAAFIRSAQELLFDASSDVDADKVLQNMSKIGKTWFDVFFAACRIVCFQAFLRRVTVACLSNCPKLAFYK